MAAEQTGISHGRPLRARLGKGEDIGRPTPPKPMGQVSDPKRAAAPVPAKPPRFVDREEHTDAKH